MKETNITKRIRISNKNLFYKLYSIYIYNLFYFSMQKCADLIVKIM